MLKKIPVLFICNANTIRSPTCERFFKASKLSEKYEFRSAGLYHGYPYQVNEELMRWAHLVFVMDQQQAKFIAERYGHPFVEVIGISDEYDPDDPKLIELIEWWITQREWRLVHYGKSGERMREDLLHQIELSYDCVTQQLERIAKERSISVAQMLDEDEKDEFSKEIEIINNYINLGHKGYLQNKE